MSDEGSQTSSSPSVEEAELCSSSGQAANLMLRSSRLNGEIANLVYCYVRTRYVPGDDCYKEDAFLKLESLIKDFLS
jgi:hypothetical protein